MFSQTHLGKQVSPQVNFASSRTSASSRFWVLTGKFGGTSPCRKRKLHLQLARSDLLQYASQDSLYRTCNVELNPLPQSHNFQAFKDKHKFSLTLLETNVQTAKFKRCPTNQIVQERTHMRFCSNTVLASRLPPSAQRKPQQGSNHWSM